MKTPKVPNHTDIDSRRAHERAPRGAKPLGTGFFLVACPPEGDLKFTVIESIKYDSACKRGKRYLGFKWVENGVMTTHLEREAQGVLLALEDPQGVCPYCQWPDPRNPGHCVDIRKRTNYALA